MKTTLLPLLAALGVVSTLVGIGFHSHELGFFCSAVSAFFLLIGTTDYGPRRSYAAALVARKERLPFAA